MARESSVFTLDVVDRIMAAPDWESAVVLVEAALEDHPETRLQTERLSFPELAKALAIFLNRADHFGCTVRFPAREAEESKKAFAKRIRILVHHASDGARTTQARREEDRLVSKALDLYKRRSAGPPTRSSAGSAPPRTTPTRQPSSEQAPTVEKGNKTVVEVDLAHYNEVAISLEEQLDDVATVRQLNKQIEGMVNDALLAVGLTPDRIPRKNTGDGAILILEEAGAAVAFAVALHTRAEERNKGKTAVLAKRHFRVGIATGKVLAETYPASGGRATYEMAGTVIGKAVRLETASRTGEVLICPDTCKALPEPVRQEFGPREQVPGKRRERIDAHRRKVVEPAAWDPAGPEAAKEKELSEHAFSLSLSKPARTTAMARARLARIDELLRAGTQATSSTCFYMADYLRQHDAMKALEWLEIGFALRPVDRELLRMLALMEKWPEVVRRADELMTEPSILNDITAFDDVLTHKALALAWLGKQEEADAVYTELNRLLEQRAQDKE